MYVFGVQMYFLSCYNEMYHDMKIMLISFPVNKYFASWYNNLLCIVHIN